MMGKSLRNTMRRVFVGLLSCAMVAGQSFGYPVTAIAAQKEVKVITEFVPLEDDVAEQTVALGTKPEELNLPDTLQANAEQVRFDPNNAEEVEELRELIGMYGDTVSWVDATASNARKATASDAVKADASKLGAEKASSSNAVKADSGKSEADPEERDDTIEVPVIWNVVSSMSTAPEYDPDTEGTYVFEADFAKSGYVLGENLFPIITVEVSSEVQTYTFDHTQVVDGMEIHVQAPSNVFPEGSVLSVEKVTQESTIRNIEEAVDGEREEAAQVSRTYLFDIKVLYEGEEIEPDTSFGNVSVKFRMLGQQIGDAEKTDVYHVTGDDENLSAEKMDVSVENKDATIAVETDSFSYYVVEFTYNELQYVLEGDTSVLLSGILATLGISGQADDVQVSDDTLIGIDKVSGASESTGNDYRISALKAFSGNEWMKVTIGSVTYEIAVTDDNESAPTGESVDEAGCEKHPGVSHLYITGAHSNSDYVCGIVYKPNGSIVKRTDPLGEAIGKSHLPGEWSFGNWYYLNSEGTGYVTCDGHHGKHEAKTDWETNETKHWHKCNVEECQQIYNEADHSYGTSGTDRYTCTLCGYVDGAFTGFKTQIEEITGEGTVALNKNIFAVTLDSRKRDDEISSLRAGNH